MPVWSAVSVRQLLTSVSMHTAVPREAVEDDDGRVVSTSLWSTGVCVDAKRGLWRNHGNRK